MHRTARARVLTALTALGAAVGVAMTPAVAVAASPAPTPAAVTRCSDYPADMRFQISAVIEGDLVADVECSLGSEARVTGDVWVEPGVVFTAYFAVLEGDMHVSGAARLYSATLAGSIYLESWDSDLRLFDDPQVHGDVVGVTNAMWFEFFSVGGSVLVSAQDGVTLRGGSIGGRLALDAHGRVELNGVVVQRNAAVAGSPVVFCLSRVHGNASVTGSLERVVLGDALKTDQCPSLPRSADGPLQVDGSLLLLHNTGGILADGVIVGRNLVCAGNRGPIDLGDVTVGGMRAGQCR